MLIFQQITISFMNWPGRLRQSATDVAGANAIAQKHGATVIDQRVTRSIHQLMVCHDRGWQHLFGRQSFNRLCALPTSNLLPEPIPLRYKTEAMVWGTVCRNG